ncbi:hypothetical protein [Halogeometricum sp. CBA1124]|uniref:hypothetical protein n=1 Tax=Halogeometricum sp. CBA1124 TaxID=2668071 RepID=UPI00142BA3F8|nr:hypothetical protein [Halogeometricum sp. CBA1124]MUV58209.1 hypothetical protein [Halogeometricum sp. CBA1124]
MFENRGTLDGPEVVLEHALPGDVSVDVLDARGGDELLAVVEDGEVPRERRVGDALPHLDALRFEVGGDAGSFLGRSVVVYNRERLSRRFNPPDESFECVGHAVFPSFRLVGCW